MTKRKTIEVTISATGEISIEALNFTGADCEKATKALENALGVSVKQTKKPEYFQTRNAAAQQKVGQ
jgi:hypothetical protein